MKILEKNDIEFVSGGNFSMSLVVLSPIIGGGIGWVGGNLFGLSSDEIKSNAPVLAGVTGSSLGGWFGAFASLYTLGVLSIIKNKCTLDSALTSAIFGGFLGTVAAGHTKFHANFSSH